LFVIDYDLGVNVPIQYLGAFDVRSDNALGFQVGVQYRATTGGAWVNYGDSALQIRDGAGSRLHRIGAPVSARQVRFQFTTGGGTANLYVGELWAGPGMILSRDYTSRRETILHSNVVHETPGGIVTARRIGADRRQLRLSFEKWNPTEHAEMATIYGATSGLLNPIALDLGVENGPPYHGRLHNDPGWDEDYPLTDRHEWIFTESGRAL
jgi:hypothetical protein